MNPIFALLTVSWCSTKIKINVNGSGRKIGFWKDELYRTRNFSDSKVRRNETADHRNFLRMARDNFDDLLALVTNSVMEQNTAMAHFHPRIVSQ